MRNPAEGDRIVRDVLRRARREANKRRERGWAPDDFAIGLDFGQVIIADNYLGADRLLVEGAKNELLFLSRYTEGRA